jgi:hypothetical protein
MNLMRTSRLVSLAVVGLLVGQAAPAQQDIDSLKSAVVTLHARPELRAQFEEGLVAKARELNYDAVTTYDFLPDVDTMAAGELVAQLSAHGVGAVLMIRPAAVGEGSTLESVRDAVSPEVLASMQAFARDLSDSGRDEVLSVVHLAIYLIRDDGASLLSSGAVWLDEPNPSSAAGIERLQNLIVANVEAVRPAIREHLGMAPLE